MTSISSALSGRHDGRATVADVAGAGDGEADRVEQRRQVVGGERRADDAVDLRHAHGARPLLRRQRRTPGVDGTGVDGEVRDTSPEQLDEAGDGRVDRRTDRRPARSGPTPPSAGRGGRPTRPMPTGANQAISRATVGGRVADLGVGAAHDPGDADRTVVGVADQQVVGRSACARRRRAWSASRRARPVRMRKPWPPSVARSYGVVRLAELEHHVVADVDDVVDRAHAGRGRAARPSTAPTGRRRRPTAPST